MSLEQQVAALVAATNALTGEVAGKMAAINAALDAKKAELDAWRAGARGEYPYRRITRNQFGNVLGGKLTDWSENGSATINVSVKRDIATGVEWSLRDAEEKAILTAMGMAGMQYFIPAIRVLRITWSKPAGSGTGNLPFHVLPMRSDLTVASYAKLVSGAAGGSYIEGIGAEWKLCGKHVEASHAGNYFHSHPYVYSDAGELELILPAAISGHFPLDPKNPRWGFFDHHGALTSFDTAI